MHVKLFQISFLVALVFTQATNGQNLEAWRYSTQLDNAGKYNLTIDVDLATQVIKFVATVDTPDWIGLGISPNPSMVGADIYMGTNDITATDYFVNSTGNTRPTRDEATPSNWITTKYLRTGTITRLEFERNFIGTGSTQDREIKDENIYLIWAYGASNASDTSAAGYFKHEATGRGSRQINLLRSPSSCLNSGSSSFKTVYQLSTVFSCLAVAAAWALMKFH